MFIYSIFLKERERERERIEVTSKNIWSVILLHDTVS